MGASETKAAQPQKLAVFKKLPYYTEVEIPERAENRGPTDRKYLIIFAVMVLILIPFLVYTLLYSDIDRYWGYDKCGNVCGRKNARYDQWECTGKDLREKKFLEYEEKITPSGARLYKKRNNLILLKSRRCVFECGLQYTSVFNTCIKLEEKSDEDGKSRKDNNELLKIAEYLNSVTWILTLSCLSSLMFTMAILYLFRVATAAMVWSILAGVATYLFIILGYFWYRYMRDDERLRVFFLILAILLTAILIIMLFLMIFVYKRVKLVIALLQEAMKAAFAMPQLLFIPILSFFAQIAIVAVFFTSQIYMGSAGVLTELINGYLDYQSNVVMSFSMIFNFWMTFCASQIVVGIQYMVIAGAVAKWYFANNKDHLDSPIRTSLSIAFKFHLGTIVFGSMVITLTAIVRSIINSLVKNKCLRCLLDCCLQAVEDFIKFLSKNAYIMTAMHGKPFYKSGKRAAHIIFQNALNIATINCVGDFILFMACVLVTLTSLLFTYLIMQGPDTGYEWCVYIIVAIVSICVSAIGLSIFETVIDTIFLCFCEDSLLNDGMARPYAMSRELMEFVDNSKKVFIKTKK